MELFYTEGMGRFRRGYILVYSKLHESFIATSKTFLLNSIYLRPSTVFLSF